MKVTLRDAVLTAVSYADIFDYPLTEEELVTWLPFRSNLKGETIKKITYRMVAEGFVYYSLQRGKGLIETRKKRAVCSVEKWRQAHKVAGLLRLIPTIKLVGVTGGLTRSNARAQDDIDFLIITSPQTLWMTRALATILLDIFHLRRRPADTQFQNLICLNMFMSQDGLAVHQKERDLFAAHEVLLMVPLWERDDAYAKFLRANAWVEKFLPNAWRLKVQSSKFKVQNHNVKLKAFTDLWFSVVVLRFAFCVLRFAELPARVIQLWYMQKRRSTEIVTDKIIRFHPRDARVWIRRALGERLASFNIPLDKIFCGR